MEFFDKLEPGTLTIDDLKALWEKLGNIPVDEEDCIELPFYHWPVGTFREEIWQWFGDQGFCPWANQQRGIIVELVETIKNEFATYSSEDGTEEERLKQAVQNVLEDTGAWWEVVRQKEVEGDLEEAVGQILLRAEEILTEAATKALHTHNPGDSTNDPVSR